APGARRRPRSESSRGRRREPLPSLQSPGAQLLEHDRVDLLDPVDPLLQVLGTGPARERGCELAFVAEAGEAVAQLRGERIVHRYPFLARRLPEERTMQAVEPRELVDRVRVVVDAQVDEHVRKA